MKWITSILVLMAVTACATPSDEQSSNTRSAPFRVVQTEAPDPSPLAGFQIPSGRCGMVLWTESSGRVSPIFRSVGVTTATMNIEGEAIQLQLHEQTGELRLGMRSEQTYTVVEGPQAGLTLDVRSDWGETFPGGLYIKGGSMTINGTTGWSRIMPVAGIAGCKA